VALVVLVVRVVVMMSLLGQNKSAVAEATERSVGVVLEDGNVDFYLRKVGCRSR
jgi:hypothetical protein